MPDRVRYTGRIFRPVPDALELAHVARGLADAHLRGEHRRVGGRLDDLPRLIAPLPDCIRALRLAIRRTLDLLRGATPRMIALQANSMVGVLWEWPNYETRGPEISVGDFPSFGPPSANERYRTDLLRDLARQRRQLAENEAARDLLLQEHGSNFRCGVRCPRCHDRAEAARLHDGRRMVLRHNRGSQVCSGSAWILPRDTETDLRYLNTVIEPPAAGH
jgi:hypothetical protein